MESGENPEQSGYCVAERNPIMSLWKREGGIKRWSLVRIHA